MKIIDNFLDKENFLKIKNLYTSNEITWNYREGIDSVKSHFSYYLLNLFLLYNAKTFHY